MKRTGQSKYWTMTSRRLLKLILAGVFVSGATLYWNLQRDLIKQPAPSMMALNGPEFSALVFPFSPGDQTPTIGEIKARPRSSPSNVTARIPLVALVSCQDRSPLTMVTLKSALMLSRRQLRFVIFADRENAKELSIQISRFPRRIRSQASIKILPVEFPASAREAEAAGAPMESRKLRAQGHSVLDAGSEWRQLFKPCSAQRLFLPDILKDEDAVLYVDTDTIFLRPIEQLWDLFAKMNESHFVAAVSESEDDKSGWYPGLARHPFVKPRGINSGVMLLNLTRLRSFDWSARVSSVYEQWKEKVVWGDQDIINIVFSNHSDAVFMLPCEWNFRPDHCQYASLCKGANRLGPGLLHGSRAVLTNNKQPAFRAVFKAFQEFTFRKRTRNSSRTPAFRPGRISAPKLVSRPKSTAQRWQLPSPTGRTKGSQEEDKSKLARSLNPARNEGAERMGRDGSKSTDDDYPVEAGFRKKHTVLGRSDAERRPVKDRQGIVEEEDEDDEMSLKERLISPLTIGIFETVNTRCGRFLKAHTKRLTRALYAKAKDL